MIKDIQKKMMIVTEAGKDILKASKVVDMITDSTAKVEYERQLREMYELFHTAADVVKQEIKDELDADRLAGKPTNLELYKMNKLLN